jgi:hypothetical protein
LKHVGCIDPENYDDYYRQFLIGMLELLLQEKCMFDIFQCLIFFSDLQCFHCLVQVCGEDPQLRLFMAIKSNPTYLRMCRRAAL